MPTAAQPDAAAVERLPTPSDVCPTRLCITDAEFELRARRLCRARRKSTILAGAGVAGVLAYGAAFWDYGSNPFHFRDDGWFGESTDYGGADKVGHMVASSVQTAIFAEINRAWGIGRKEAALRGALTAFAIQSMVEFGDGFTKVHGFTYGDLVADAVGCVFGYFHESSPWFQRTFDLRWEYWPSNRVLSGEDYELTTDYEGSSYLLAVNAGSVLGRPRSLLNLVEFQVGYNTRHYQDLQGAPERNLFVGVGPSLPNLFRRLGWHVPARFFEFYQPPCISLRLSTNLND